MKKPKKAKVDGDVEFQDAADGKHTDRLPDGVSPTGRPHPPPEEDLGGGDICSPELSTDDDAPPA